MSKIKVNIEEISIGNTFKYWKDIQSMCIGKVYCINYKTVTIGNLYERHTSEFICLIPVLIDSDYLKSIGGLYLGDDDCGYNWKFENPDVVLWDNHNIKTNSHTYQIRSFDRLKSIEIKYVHQLQNIFKYFFGVII